MVDKFFFPKFQNKKLEKYIKAPCLFVLVRIKVFWLVTKKEHEKELKKISKSFKKVSDEIKEFQKDIVSRKEVDLMIREKALEVHESAPQSPQSPQSKIRKKANIILNKAEILHEIGSLLSKGLSTMEIHDIIITQKQLCKKTCFYNYLKKVRALSPRTPQTDIVN